MHNTQARKFFWWVMLACLGCGALFSLGTGVHHAMEYQSHDLQWMGGHLVRQHIDPWQEKLADYPHHFDHFSPPNYLHLLYLLFLPFSSLSFYTAEILWCATSICFSIAVVGLLHRIFPLDRFQALLLLFLLWMSTPFRVVLEVGQMSLFELFFICLTYVAASTWIAGCAFGISFVKYSFSPTAVILFLLRGRIRILVIAVAVTCFGLLGVRLFLSTPLFQLAREPFLVSRVSVSPGLADLMTFSEFALKSFIQPQHATAASYVLGVLGSICYAILLSRYRLTRSTELVLISLAGLLFFKHLVYDYVFLLVPLAFAITQKSRRVRYPIIAGILVFWFVAAFLNRASTDLSVSVVGLFFNFALLGALVAYTTVVILREAPLISHTAGIVPEENASALAR